MTHLVEDSPRPHAPEPPAGPVERLRALTLGAAGTDEGETGRSAAIGFFSRVLNAGVVFLTHVMFARTLGPEQFGHYTTAQSLLLLVAGIVTLGLVAMPQRFWPEYVARRQIAHLRGLVRFAHAAPPLIGLSVTIAALVLLWLVQEHIGRDLALVIGLALLALPALALVDVVEGLALTNGWNDLAYGMTFVLRPVMVPAIYLTATGLGVPADASIAIAAATGAALIAAVALIVALAGRINRVLPPGPAITEDRRWILACLPVMIVDASLLLMTSTDVLLLALLSGQETVGLYGAAARLVALVTFVHFGISWAAAHHFSRFAVSGENDRLARYARQTAVWTFLPSLILALIVAALTPLLLTAFGQDYAVGAPITWILMAGLIARAMIGPAEQVLIMTDNQSACAIAYGWGFLLNAGLSVWLIPSFGGPGAAIATAAGYALSSLLLALAIRRRLGFWPVPIPARKTSDA
jgi:O-antigen/teichoic acid export membrane protein